NSIKVNNSTDNVILNGTAWSFTASINSGVNVFDVKAIDGSSNESGTTTIKIMKPAYTFVTVGDSVTKGQGSSDGNGYITYLQSDLDAYYGLSTTFVNGGVGGELTPTGLLKGQSNIRDNAPKAVFILEGHNDAKNTGSAWVAEAVEGTLLNLIQYAKSMGATPIIGLLIPHTTDSAKNSREVELNNLLRTIALEEDVMIADHYTVFSEYPNFTSALYIDDTHPNNAGYEVLANNWYNAFIYGKKLHTNRNRISTNYSMDFDDAATVKVEATTTDEAPITVDVDNYSQGSSQITTDDFKQLTLTFTDLTPNTSYKIYTDDNLTETKTSDGTGKLTFSHANDPASSNTFEIKEAVAPTLSNLTLSPVSPLKAGTVTMTLNFSEDMDQATNPTITFGTASPYTQRTVSTSPTGWTNATTFAAQIDIQAGWDGLNTIKVSGAKDLVGNTMAGNNSNTFTIDTALPATTASVDSGTYNTAKSVTLSCDDGTGSGCDKIYYTTTGADPTTDSDQYSLAISISSDTTLKFFAKDKVGNSESIKTKTYVIDTSGPTTTILTTPASSTTETSATFTFSSDDGLATFKCKKDSEAYADCTTPKSYPGLDVGSHTFYVKAIDSATNEDLTSASYTWTISAVATEDDDEEDSAGYKEYKKLKKDYNNSTDKKNYTEVKNIKKINPALFAQMKAIYDQYKKLSKTERNKLLDAKTRALFDKYKSYKGYKDYKAYKKKYG
ncbi:MAG: GDSL-type esterase/lipase family protein, partial [Candidatus Moranbacteria bacterium]|nr:GDSL-type esterase/lipase family protein [Candidatus Moranbacteria bacterium]